MRRQASWLAFALAALAMARAGFMLADPAPPSSDLPTFILLALGALMAFLGSALRSPARWWTWWLPAAWIGCAIATLTLAYKDSLVAEWGELGALTVLWHVAIHVLIAPIELFFGFAVGFIDPDAWMYVVAAIGVSLLGAESIRRRLWPARWSSSSGVVREALGASKVRGRG